MEIKIDRRTTTIAAFVVIVAVVAVANPMHFMDNKTARGAGQNTQASNQDSGGGKDRVKLSNTKYARYAYKISDDKVTQEEKRALAGFKVSKDTSGEVTTINLNTTKSEYSNQTYRLKNGEQLYFIETSMGDDSGGHEYAMEDDQGVVVDSDGYIVRT